jgi:hypothetical protein
VKYRNIVSPANIILHMCVTNRTQSSWSISLSFTCNVAFPGPASWCLVISNDWTITTTIARHTTAR